MTFNFTIMSLPPVVILLLALMTLTAGCQVVGYIIARIEVWKSTRNI